MLSTPNSWIPYFDAACEVVSAASGTPVQELTPQMPHGSVKNTCGKDEFGGPIVLYLGLAGLP